MMASISSNQINERDALLYLLQCKSRGRSQDKFFHISNMNKNNIIDLPASVQRSFDQYVSTGSYEVIVISK